MRCPIAATVALSLTSTPWAIELVLHQDGQLGVQRRQHLRRGLDHRHVDALSNQVLRHLQADETRPDDDGARRRRLQVLGQAGGVLDGA